MFRPEIQRVVNHLTLAEDPADVVQTQLHIARAWQASYNEAAAAYNNPATVANEIAECERIARNHLEKAARLRSYTESTEPALAYLELANKAMEKYRLYRQGYKAWRAMQGLERLQKKMKQMALKSLGIRSRSRSRPPAESRG